MQLMSKFIYFNNSQESFNSVDYWLKELRTHSNPDIQIFLIGNKCDLEDKYIILFFNI